MRTLPFDEINLVDLNLNDGRFHIEMIIDNGNNDMYSPMDIVILQASKENMTEIDNLIEILKFYKKKILKQ